MKKKRDRLEVINDILLNVQAKGEIGPTRLLQLSNLSPQMFKGYLTHLLDKGLIGEKIKKNKKRYMLGEKGYEFLSNYRKFSNFVGKLGI